MVWWFALNVMVEVIVGWVSGSRDSYLVNISGDKLVSQPDYFQVLRSWSTNTSK